MITLAHKIFVIILVSSMHLVPAPLVRNPSTKPTPRPIGFPSSQPTGQPSRQPSRQPTGQPSRRPSRQPSGRPSSQPSYAPTNPTGQPSISPTGQPSRQPSYQPSSQPSRRPSKQPSGQPSSNPSGPTSQPSRQPSSQPSSQPSTKPTITTNVPSSSSPSSVPSSSAPTRTSRPSSVPSSSIPTSRPSGVPTKVSPKSPTSQPTAQPSRQPSGQPSRQPTTSPTWSQKPSFDPTAVPTGQPSSWPSSSRPTSGPTDHEDYNLGVKVGSSAVISTLDTEVCSPVHLTLSFSVNKAMVAPFSIVFQTAGLTSGPCTSPEDGANIDEDSLVRVTPIGGTLFPFVRYKEGSFKDGYAGSSISLTVRTADYSDASHGYVLPADTVFTFDIDRINGLKRIPSTVTSWVVKRIISMEEDYPMGTVPLVSSSMDTHKAFAYNASLTFDRALQQFPTSILISFSASFRMTYGYRIRVRLPGFTAGNYNRSVPYNDRKSYSSQRYRIAKNNSDLTIEWSIGYLGDTYQSSTLRSLRVEQPTYLPSPQPSATPAQPTAQPVPPGTPQPTIHPTPQPSSSSPSLQPTQEGTDSEWTAVWVEGSMASNFADSHLYLTLNSMAPTRVGETFNITVQRYPNQLTPVCGSPTNSPFFTFEFLADSSNVLYIPERRFDYSGPVGKGCQELNDCNNNGVCNFCTSTCSCYDGFGSSKDVRYAQANTFQPDCSAKSCPVGPSIASFRSPNINAPNMSLHDIIECSNNGVCDRSSGVCKCFDGYGGTACNRMLCLQGRKRDSDPSEICSGRGSCLSMKNMAMEPEASPLPQLSSQQITYQKKVVFSTSWDAEFSYGCVCDSSWPVGYRSGETQDSEYFGAACEMKRCPTGDDPSTVDVDETDCYLKSSGNSPVQSAIGVPFVGQRGNKCHVDCSNRGLCNHKTGICSCFPGYKGSNCGQFDTYARVVVPEKVDL